MVKHIWHSLAVLTWVLSAGLSLAAAHPKTVCDKMDCDLIVSPPEVVDGDCGGNTIHLEYSIFNDSPQLQTFTFSLDEITPSTLATVEITDSTCGPNFTTTGGSGLVGPGQTCILTISVIPTSDITCTPGCIDWELTIIHANQTIVEPIDPCFSPPPPPGACVGATPTNPLGDSSKFIVLGGSKVKNDNNPIYTTLCGGDVGVSPGTTITNLTDVDNYVGACSGTGTVHTPNDLDSQIAHDCVCELIKNAVAHACTPQSGDLGSLGTASYATGGYYCFPTSTNLKGKLTLNPGPTSGVTDIYYFIFDGNFHVLAGTPSNPTVIDLPIVMGDQVDPNDIWWIVLGPHHKFDENSNPNALTDFKGNVLAVNKIQINNQAGLTPGRALTCMGEVDLHSVNIVKP